MAMTRASNILLAGSAAMGLSVLSCAPTGAQPSGFASATQPGGNIGQADTSSVIAPPLLTPTNTAFTGQPQSPISVTTRALLPGHWALHGSNYVWVPPETKLRAVQTAALLQGGYVWRNGTYVWVPTHYAKP
jgi:hypothetical protein